MSAFALKRMTPWPTISKPPCDVCESTRATAAHGQSFARPFVHDNGDTRSLHFTLDELQSRMNKRHPWRLEVDYTRTMMGFLLLVPEPASISMVGLGGGSLAKFCYRQLPACRITVVEINPYVIALRRDFCVPDDDVRFEVLSPRRIKLQTSLARLSIDAGAELKPKFACMVWAMKDLAG